MSHSVQYGKSEYWDDRYRRDRESFDWYQRWPELKPILAPHIQTSARILMVGCGNSTVSRSMVDDGYTNMVNIDISSVVIDAMKTKHPDMTWAVMDCTKMTYSNEFEAVIDKGEYGLKNHSVAYLIANRALKPGGVFFEITYGQPTSRLNHLQKPEFMWTVETLTLAKPETPSDVHYIYMCVKAK